MHTKFERQIPNYFLANQMLFWYVKDGIRVNVRKLLMMPNTLLDYDDPGANPRHDPRKKPGTGRNP